MGTREPIVNDAPMPAIVRDLDWALAEVFGSEKLDEALQVIADQARVMVGAHQAAVSYIPGGDFVAAVHAIAFSDKYEKYLSYDVMPTGVGIWAVIIEQKISIRMTQEELTSHPRWKNFSDMKDARGLEHPPMRGWLAVPILARSGDLVGVLQLSDKYEGEFTERDLALLQNLAKLITPTLELQLVNSQLQDRTAELATANQGLHAIEERLSLALKSSEVGTWSWNVVENLIIWDDFIHPLFGLKPGTFPGRYEDFLETLHPEDRERVTEEVARAVEDNSDAAYDTEFQVVWPDGSVHVLGSRGKVYRDAAGRAIRMTGVCWDITARKRAQEALAFQAEELARSNADLEQFAYVASHDLQEPLRAVTGYCQLLQHHCDDQLDDKARGFTKHIVEGGERMQALIAGLLEYSRIGTRGKSPHMVDIEPVVESAIQNLQAAIQETGAQVDYGPMPNVRADRLQLTRLFQNLIGNALKYHGPSVPEIHITAQKQDDEWMFSVRDNGIGFDSKYAEKIFTIFKRLHTRRVYPGTGIGLALCERIVQRHGGRIWAESAPDEGSVFHFTLPNSGGARA